MRFDRIEEFSIEQLHLDEGNYRFMHAADQEECIGKIFFANKPAFINLMDSLAEDDLGELLLVYQTSKDSVPIVMDGNRRTAALKVLHKPALAPSRVLRERAQELAARCRVDFERLQVQVSDDKAVVLRTVYERHAAGQGRSRINWNALANAKFRYEERQFHGQDWHDIALLMELEARGDEVTEFVNGKGYSHEVFRRIIRIAEQMGVIDRSIFSERDQRIKKSAGKRLDESLDRVRDFLQHMQAGQLTLSRKGGTYADKNNIEAYLRQFLPEDGAGTDATTDDEAVKVSGRGASEREGDGSGRSGREAGGQAEPVDEEPDEPPVECEGDEGAQGPEGDEDLSRREPTRVPSSPSVVGHLNRLRRPKLSSLYGSLTTLSLRSHPVLCMVGAWSFLEALSRGLGASSSTSFDSYLGSKSREWFPDKTKGKTMRQSLLWISAEANCNKHDDIYMTMNATPLVNHFAVLEPLILMALKKMCELEPEEP